MKTAAAYIRVSTEEQTEFSPDSQLKKIKEYAKHNNILLPEKFIFMDEGISGKYAKKRPEFMKMIKISKTKPKPFDLILVWKFSRFARNRQDSIIYKSMLRKDFNIDVVSITEQLSKDSTSILIEALLEAMDEYYSINLAEEVKRGMNEKFSRGEVVSAPPFGYKMGKNRFETDEEKAKIVKMIFSDFTNGISTRQIAMKLNDMGISSKRGNKFEKRTIEYILSNPVYIGKLRRSIDRTDDNSHYGAEKNFFTVEGKHNPIIDIKTFKTAENILKNIKSSHPARTQTTHTDFMFRGLIRCSSCGSTLTQSVRGKALQCHKYSKGQCGESHSISITKINEAILDKIKSDLNKSNLNITIKRPHGNDSKDTLKTLLKKEYKKLARIKSAYENGIDSMDEYKKSKTKLMKKINELENEISKPIKNKVSTQNNFKKPLSDILEQFKSKTISENEKNEILKALMYKAVFNRKNSTIQIYYHV